MDKDKKQNIIDMLNDEDFRDMMKAQIENEVEARFAAVMKRQQRQQQSQQQQDQDTCKGKKSKKKDKKKKSKKHSKKKKTQKILIGGAVVVGVGALGYGGYKYAKKKSREDENLYEGMKCGM